MTVIRSDLPRARSVPPQVPIQHTPGDEAELHLRRALHDRQLLGVPVPLLGRVVLHVHGRAEELDGERRGPHGLFGGVVLGHGEVREVSLGERVLVGQHGSPVGQQPGRLNVDGELGDLPLDALEVGDGLCEGLPLLCVVRGLHERALGQTDAARGDDRAHGVQAQHGQAEAVHLTDDVVGRHVDIAEHQLAGVHPLDAYFLAGAAHLDPVAPFHDEGRHRIVSPAGGVARRGEDGAPVRLPHPRHPALGAIQHPAALVGHPAGPHPMTSLPAWASTARGSAQGAVADTGQAAPLVLLGAGDLTGPVGSAGA